MKNTLLFKNYLKAILLFAFFALGQTGFGQVTITSATGTGSPSVTYSTLASAITAINDGVTHTGTIVCAVDAGYAETAPAGGFVITATGTSGSTITFQKNGAGTNPTINAGIGTATPASIAPDGIFSIRGGDFITIDSFTFTDGNTTNPATMEFGIGFFKASSGNGCNNNTVQNCIINMQRVNNAAATAPMIEGAVGILVINATATAATTSLTPTNGGTLATNGTNSGNKFYTNTINGGNYGIGLSGFAASSGVGPTPTATTFLGDLGNDIGGTASGTGNTILNFGGGAVTSVAAGIRANNQWSLNISYNTIDNNNGSGVNHATTLRGIFAQAGTSGAATINNNNVTVRSGATTSGLTAIDNVIGSTAVSSNTININNNTIRFSYTTATTGLFTAISNTATAGTVNINTNNIQQLAATNYPSTGTVVVIVGGSPGGPMNINTNTISNFTMTGATGTLRAITASTPTGLYTVSGNIIENLSYTTAASTGSITGIYNVASATLENVNSNIIRNFATPTTGTLNGIQNNTVAGTFQCRNNQIYNFSTTAGGAGGFSANGITWSNANVDLTGNIIYAINSTGTTGGSGGSISGITFSGAATVNKNAIYDLSSNSTNVVIFGINVSAAGTNTLSNNLVGDLKAPNSTGNISISGIVVPSGTTNNIYHNTVNIASTTTSATTFGTSAIYFSSSTPINNLRNNIFVNTSTPGPTGGFTAAIRYSAAPTTTNFPVANNNNFYYAGTASTTRVLYGEGSTAAATNGQQTIAAYKTYISTTLPASGRESASVTEVPNFVSTIGSNPVTNFLKYNTAIATQIEQGGITGTGIATDYSGTTVRCPGGVCPGSTATPDMGAWELNGIASDLTGPAITNNSQSVSVCSPGSRVVSATITDASGVPITGVGLPVAYWNSNGGAFTSVTGVSAGSGVYNFTIASGTNFNDAISYYFVAQDAASTPNITSLPLAGASGFTTNPPAVSTIPTTPFSYIVNTPLNGTYTVGAAGNYPTLTAAINSFNNSCLSGAVVFELIDATYNEAGAMTINSNSTSSSTNTLTIRPAAGVVATISATVASGYVLKVLNSFTAVNGSNNNSTSRNLTISNLSTTSPGVVNIGSVGTSPITGVSLRNTIVINGANTATAVMVSDATTPGNAGYFTNITVQNNSVQRAFVGIYAIAAVVAGNGNSTLISDNSLNTSGTNAIRYIGIYNQGIDGTTINNNTIANIANTVETSNMNAIWLATGTTNAVVSNNTISNLSGTTVGPRGVFVSSAVANSNILVSKNIITGLTSSAGSAGRSNGVTISGASGGVIVDSNTISNIKNTNTGGWGTNGIELLSSSLTANVRVSNNIIFDVAAYGFNDVDVADNGYGIIVSSGAGYQIYHNTVNMNTNQTEITGRPAAFNVLAAVTTAGAIDLRNNIFNNSQTVGTNRYAIVSGATNTVFSSIDFNDYFTSAPNLGYIGATDRANLADIQTSFGQNINSLNISPVFISGTNQRLLTTANATLDNKGTLIATVTLDIDGDLRSSSTPDLGADEFTATPTLLTWTGSTSSSWNLASNWSPAVIPNGTINVLINTVTPNAPVLDIDFTLATGKTLTVSGSGTLTINPTRTFTITGTADFGGKSITLKSDVNGTASIGQVTGSLTGATNVTVERYIALGRRAFRFLTPGVTTTTSIFANWQNGGATTAGIGTHITGSTTIANGFDVTTSGNPSLHTYNAQALGTTTTGFTPIPNTDVTTLKAGVGYRLLVRGDRNVVLSNPSADDMNVATTLSAKGTLTTGTVTFDATNSTSPVLVNNNEFNTQTNGYTLIGNPYASPVDWNAVTKTGVAADAYYAWDPTLGTTLQRGRYVVYSPTLGTNLYDNGLPSGQANRRYLQSGQAVFIKNAALATPATLIFNESNKASIYSYVNRSSQEALTSVGNSALYLTAYEPNELALGGTPIDGAVALFGTSFTNALDAQDVVKLTASGENVAFARENKTLAIETLAPVVAEDVLFVKTLSFQANKSYTFKVNTENFDTSVSAKMVDLYLNTETAIDLTQPSFVSFTTTADAGSYGSDRFKIVFNSAALGTPSYSGSSISIYPNPIVNNRFNIAMPSSVSGKVEVAMSNMLGQVVYNQTSEASATMVVAPRQQLEDGIYIVSVTNNGKVMQSKVVVKK